MEDALSVVTFCCFLDTLNKTCSKKLRCGNRTRVSASLSVTESAVATKTTLGDQRAILSAVKLVPLAGLGFYRKVQGSSPRV